MIAKDLIDFTIPPLKPSDNGKKALTWLSEFPVQHLPLISGKNYLGIITQEEVWKYNNDSLPLDDYSDLSSPYVYEKEYAFNVLKLGHKERLSVIPVLNEEGHYVGCITLEKLMIYFASTSSTQEPGGIIILDLNVKDYSMTQIAQIIESNQARLLSMYTSTPINDLYKMEVTLKVNRTDLSQIIATFERYEYKIKAAIHETPQTDNLQERLNALFKFLDV